MVQRQSRCSALLWSRPRSFPIRLSGQRPHLSCAVAPRNGAPRQSVGGLAELLSVQPIVRQRRLGLLLAVRTKYRIRRLRTIDREIMSCIVPEDVSLARSFLVTWWHGDTDIQTARQAER